VEADVEANKKSFVGSRVTPRVRNFASLAATVSPKTKYPEASNDAEVETPSLYVAATEAVFTTAIVEITVEVPATEAAVYTVPGVVTVPDPVTAPSLLYVTAMTTPMRP
jgi:hypothetical protein